MKGTKNKKIKKIINKGVTNFFRSSVSIIDINIINVKAKIVKIKCLEKKEIIIFIEPFSCQS